MTGKEFRAWQASVEVEGRPMRGSEVARKMGITPEHVSRLRRDGSSKDAVYRLAMAAISSGIKPWGMS